jgi:hypothetical protein
LPDRSKPPWVSTLRNSARARSLSRPTRSYTKRSKFDAFEMSIDGLLV